MSYILWFSGTQSGQLLSMRTSDGNVGEGMWGAGLCRALVMLQVLFDKHLQTL